MHLLLALWLDSVLRLLASMKALVGFVRHNAVLGCHISLPVTPAGPPLFVVRVSAMVNMAGVGAGTYAGAY